MRKELLLYTSIYSYTVADFIRQMEENVNADITLRINTNGGSPEDAYGMIAKIKEHKGGFDIKVDGKAYSTGAYLLCFAKGKKSALDLSDFLFHRAAYAEWIESSLDYMTPDMWASLDRVNAQLRAAFEATVDVNKFEKITGVTVEALFANTSRIEVTLTAQQALEIGLIDEIVTITPEKKAELKNTFRIAAEKDPQVVMPAFLTKVAETTPVIPTKQNNNMTLAEFKAQHPSLYAEVVKEGVTEERDRVGALMAFVDVDASAVVKAIKEGAPLTQTMTAEFTRKAMSAQGLKGLKADNAEDIETEETEAGKTAERQQLEAFNKKVKENLKGAKS